MIVKRAIRRTAPYFLLMVEVFPEKTLPTEMLRLPNLAAGLTTFKVVLFPEKRSPVVMLRSNLEDGSTAVKERLCIGRVDQKLLVM